MLVARLTHLLVLVCLGLPACMARGDGAFEPEIPALPGDPAEYGPIERYDFMVIPADNPLTPAGAALGRQLYYDPRLSGDGVRSCYSCHVCEQGLTDGRALALGAFDKTLTRSSPTLWNIGYHSEFYWDGRAKSLESQALAAWKGGNMGASDPQAIVDALNAIEGYRSQFQDVFGGPASVDNVPQALASYMRTIISDDTPWDRWQKGDASAVSEAARRGYALFQEVGCAECHVGVLFTDQQFHNVGIGMQAEEPDLGRFKVTDLEQNRGAFKTPTLRDITQSAPYFHDGSVPTLEEAVRLMAKGGLDNPWRSDKLQSHALTDAQVADLLAFLESLDQPCDPAPPRLP